MREDRSKAASLDADASDDPSLSQKAATGEPHPETHSKLQACQAMPADEGAGRQGLELQQIEDD